MTRDKDDVHAASGSVGHAALGAAGEAAAFFAGAPIAGAADAAVELGDAVADREARFEDAIIHGHASPVTGGSRSRWPWLVIAVVVVAIGLALLLR